MASEQELQITKDCASEQTATPTAAEVLRQLHELNMFLVRSKINVKRDHHAAEEVPPEHELQDSDELSPLSGQGRVLATLSMWRHKRDGVDLKDLSIIMGTSRKTLAELVDELEEKLLVRRSLAKGESSVPKIKLTRDGMKTAWEICHRYSNDSADLFDCLDQDELTQLSAYLERVIENAQSKLPDSRIKERRNAMREYLHLNHLDREDGEA